MDENRFEQLLNGDKPTLDDFAGFLSVVEKLPVELLWNLVNNNPNLDATLRNAALKVLQEKIARVNVDNAINAIVTRLKK